MTRCMNSFSSRKGSILLETILVIPVLVVLLGGVFWIGELMLSKTKLLMADRYAAWNAGNRHRMNKGGIQGELQNTYFRYEEVGDQAMEKIVFEGGKPTTWCTPVGATVYLRMVMPEWTEGWLAGSPTWEGVVPAPNEKIQVGRNVPDLSHHALLMRTLYSDHAYRSPSWTPRMLADWSRPWFAFVYDEEWPEMGDLHPRDPSSLLLATTPGGPSGYRHDRHGAYVSWSY